MFHSIVQHFVHNMLFYISNIFLVINLSYMLNENLIYTTVKFEHCIHIELMMLYMYITCYIAKVLQC